MVSAPAPLSVMAWAGGPVSWSVSISRPGATRRPEPRPQPGASRSSISTSVTVSYWPGPAREQTILGSTDAVDTIRSGAPRSTASPAAQLDRPQ